MAPRTWKVRSSGPPPQVDIAPHLAAYHRRVPDDVGREESEAESADTETPVVVEADTVRLAAFSDAVMAVIMTIMAFQLHPPGGRPSRT